MKRLKVLSHLKMRVIPMIMVSTLLCSNFVSVKALAEGEATESTTEVSENGDEPADDSQNDSNDTTEDSSDEADAEDTSSSDDASEGTDEADGEDSSDSSNEGSSDEADADASTEASSEEDASDAASSDMSEEPEDIYVNEDNLEFVSFSIDIEEDGDSDFTITSDIDNTKTVQNEDGQSVTTVDSVEATLNDDSTYDVLIEDSKIAFQYSVNDYYAVEASLNGGVFQEFDNGVIEYSVNQLREDNDLFIKTEGMDIEGPEIKDLKIPGDNGSSILYFYGSEVKPLTFHVEAKRGNDGSLLELGAVKINYTYNNASKSVTLTPDGSGDCTWAPAVGAYGEYHIESITAVHKIGETTVYDNKIDTRLPITILYREKVECSVKASLKNDPNASKWYSTAGASQYNPTIVVTGKYPGEASHAHLVVSIPDHSQVGPLKYDNIPCHEIDSDEVAGSEFSFEFTIDNYARDLDGAVELRFDVTFDGNELPETKNSGDSASGSTTITNLQVFDTLTVQLDNSDFQVDPDRIVGYDYYPVNKDESTTKFSKYYFDFINTYFVNKEAYALVSVPVKELGLGSPIKAESITFSTAQNYNGFGSPVSKGYEIKECSYDQQKQILTFQVHFTDMKEKIYYRIDTITVTDAVGHVDTVEVKGESVFYNSELPSVDYRFSSAAKTCSDPSDENKKIYFWNQYSFSKDQDGKLVSCSCGEVYIYDAGGFYDVSFTDGNGNPLGDGVKHENGTASTVAFTNNEKHLTYFKERAYSIKLPEGEYVINTHLRSVTNQNTVYTTTSEKVVADGTGPLVTVNCDADFKESSEGDGEYYIDKATDIVITIKERYPDMDAIRNAIHFSYNGEEIEVAVPDIVPGDPQNQEIVIEIPVDEDGEYEFRIDNFEDYAGNGSDIKLENIKERFILDKEGPELLPITFDNDDVHNGKYYNKARVATITVLDTTFSKNLSKIEVTSKYGKAQISDWSGDDKEKEHTATVTFSEDGIYSFTVTVYDRAGHGPVTASVEEFVIDTTEPKVTVTYTNNDAKNQMYYNKARTAILDIEEMSFDAELVEYGMQPIDEGSQLPTIGGFSTSEKVNTTNMTFDQDGKYAYVINCTDLAGNTATSYISDIFVIDTIAPEVDFSGVDNFSANNGTVAPTVKYVDKNMDMEATVVTMTGSNNGPVAVGSAVTETEDGFVVSYDDFAHDKSMDDLYTLTAKVYDLAGNESEEELVFSVNRFGSVFVLGDATKILNEEYYTNDPKDITITEINVDELTYRDISISCDGDITELEKGADYTVTSQGSDTTWKTYTYTLSSENFDKDGVYSVTVYTKDRASNTQDNKSRDAEINFAVDMTKPSIVTTGIESDTTYNKSSIGVNINVADNMGLTSFDIFRGEKHVGSYTAEELDSNGGTIEITLEEADKEPFDLKLVAVDVAGNEEVLTYSNVTVAVETTEIVDPPVPLPGPDKDNNKVNIFIFIIIGFGAVALASGAGIFAYQNKKKSE